LRAASSSCARESDPVGGAGAPALTIDRLAEITGQRRSELWNLVRQAGVVARQGRKALRLWIGVE